MSDTPRTDAECKDIRGDAYITSVPEHGDYVDADFARQLERELAEAKIGAARYEYLRKLNPLEFQKMYLECLHMDLNFDAEVDRRRNAK